jgi:hypothetical protein
MDIREVSEEEKKRYIERVKASFDDLRNMLNTVEIDMVSTDLITQASAVWIGGNLCSWYSDFITQIKEIDQKQKSLRDIQDEIRDVTESQPGTAH